MVEVKLNTKYRLLCLETGTYLTRSKEDGHSIIGHAFTEEKGQEVCVSIIPGQAITTTATNMVLQWVFQSSGDNDYTIKAADINKWLAINEISEDDQLQCNRIPAIWNVWDVENMGAVVRITTMYGNCIDVFKGGKANGTKIQLWRHTGGNNQLWLLEEVNRD